jgi:ubiquinone/menaquinone biosynthesis C-methylase UbiE/uncharacterized protein YbaR (Trm112 family)
MYRDCVDILKCPICGNDFELKPLKEENEIIEGEIFCSEGHVFNIVEGVLNFNSKEQEGFNNWSEVEKKYGFEESDKRVSESTPQNQKQATKKANEYILNSLRNNKSKSVVDIATGRAGLAKYLVKNFKNEIKLVCTDLSLAVLIYDRKDMNKINSDMKINFVACDASNLPFKDDSFDSSVSLCGIQNMMDLTQKGVEEAVRVSKKELINSCITIKNDNPKIDLLNDFLKDNNFDIDVKNFTEGFYNKIHNLDNCEMIIEKVFEDIAEKNDNDLLPIEGEPFSMEIYRVIK